MRNFVLASVLIVALLVGFGTVIFYNIQDYDYKLELKESIPTSDVYVKFSTNSLWNGTSYVINESGKYIQSFSTIIGQMSFENNGSLSRVIELPRFVGCVDLSETAPGIGSVVVPYDYSSRNFAYWLVYSLNKPVFETNLNSAPVPQVYSEPMEIYPQYNYAGGGSQPNVEIKKGDKLTYYIYFKDSYVYAYGNSSSYLNKAKIKIYEVPMKYDNPLSEGISYDSLIYNPTCEMLAKEFEPIKTIEIV